MLFNSFEFILFLPIVFCLYWFVFNKSVQWQNLFIVVASSLFYGWYSYLLLGLLGISIALNYLFGLGVNSSVKSKAKIILWLSVFTNIGILYLLKYRHFFDIPFNDKLQNPNLQPDSTAFDLVVPLGLSFYTLRAMSYVIDVYKGKTKPVASFIDYAVFQSFFPLLLAGPLERVGSLMPQIVSIRKFDYAQAVEGSRRIIWGMFKKMVIANNLALIVERIFNSYQGHSATSLIIGAIAFSFQLYADVSSYADIVIGIAILFGFKLSENFRYPYFSRNLIEFWDSWHITLTSWFKDYIYLPIKESKTSIFRTTLAILVGFLAMAIWHYASSNFIVWGLIHAIGVIALLALRRNKNLKKGSIAENKLFPGFIEFIQMLVTFTFVTLAWVFFRTERVSDAYQFIKRIITNSIQYPEQYLQMPIGSSVIIYIFPFLLLEWWMRIGGKNMRVPKNKAVRFILYYLLVVMAYFMLERNGYNYMYFKF